MTTAEPGLDAFAKTYGEGRAQLVWMRVVDDLETPVSAYLKIGHGRPYAFLYESVEGGAWRGRYSIIALEPDLVWRSFGGRAERAEGTDIASGRFTPEAKPTLESLRDLVAECRFDLPPGLPPPPTAWASSAAARNTWPILECSGSPRIEEMKRELPTNRQ